MKTQILDGYQLAEQHKKSLQTRVKTLEVKPVIAAILFVEDTGSVLYTNLKQEMAQNLGIGYQVFTYSLRDGVGEPVKKIQQLNKDSAVTGIIVQKPWRNRWLKVRNLEGKDGKQQFDDWWQKLVITIEPSKDVDGLHPGTEVLPATCRAVIGLLKLAFSTDQLFEHLKNNQLKVVILGKSDLLGKPLFSLLQSEKIAVEMIGSQELKERIEQGISLRDADVIVTATGRRKLITGEMVKDGVVVIDVGEPKGDMDFDEVKNKAKAITPVPGGVGPMTVISLMENAVDLL